MSDHIEITITVSAVYQYCGYTQAEASQDALQKFIQGLSEGKGFERIEMLVDSEEYPESEEKCL